MIKSEDSTAAAVRPLRAGSQALRLVLTGLSTMALRAPTAES
jgi:hypothetical protein